MGSPLRGAVRTPELEASARTYARVERALEWLGVNFERRPSLAEAAHAAGFSASHFQRHFTEWAGISPKVCLQVLGLEQAKCALGETDVFDAGRAAGPSGPGRLHDRFVRIEAVTPGEYRRRGEGLLLRYGWYPSPFGECLVVHGARGICGLGFQGARTRASTLAELLAGYERASVRPDDGAGAPLAERAFAAPQRAREEPLPLLVRGTPFQITVWRSLVGIPPGRFVSYAQLAAHIGREGAPRAVGRAVGANAIAWLIPCHRAIRRTGGLAGYRWGFGRKLAMLIWEARGAGARAGAPGTAACASASPRKPHP